MMQYRNFGEDLLSVVGFGGICVMDETPHEADRIVATAIDRGITYFDVAPSYGNAEEILGPALQPYRDDVFLACKTTVRDADGARKQLHESLGRLRTDRFDLYQIHAIQTQDEVDQVLSPGGILELMIRAREEGLIRKIGFSAHHEDAALRLLSAFKFDSILFPVNRYVWFSGAVGPRIIDAAKAAGTSVLALKALAERRWREGEVKTWAKTWYKPVETYEEAKRGLRFTLSQPVVAAVSPGHEELLWWACDAVDEFEPFSPEEMERIRLDAESVEPIFSRSIGAI